MNIKELADRLGLEEDEFLELAELFVDSGSSDHSKLQKSIDQSDIDGVMKSAHSIKGASGNLGFTNIYEIAKDVEQNARDSSLDGAEEAAKHIKKHLNDLAVNLAK